MDFKAYLENPQLLHEGTEPNRSYVIPYFAHRPESIQTRLDSDRVTPLSGDWDFHFYESIQGLEENGIMSREEIETALDAFQKENGFSDEILKAIQDGNIEGMIPAFVDAKDSRYQSLIGLTLRNIVRFVSSYIRIEKGQFVTSHSAKYIAYQHTTGDYDGFLGFTCDDDSILALADGYAKETFDTVDEDALDSVCEFTNCVNGLYATELSYQDTTIDMQPPEFKFDSSIDGEGEFYVLPVYIDGKHSDLIVKLG